MKKFNLPKLDINTSISYITIEEVKNALANDDFDSLNQLYYLFINRDLKIAEGIEKRKDKLLSLEWEIKNRHPLLEKISINELIKALLDSIYYGYAIVDIDWEVRDNLLIPSAFKKVHPLALRKWDNTIDEYYYFYEKNTLKEIKLEDVEKRVLFYNHTKSDYIHTEALAYKIAFYAVLKHTAIVYNMQYFDSLAIPPIIVKSSSVDDDKSLSDLISAMQNLKSNSFGIFDKEIDIDTLLKTNSQTDFLSLISYFDNLMSLYITGLGTAAEGSKSGSYALSQTSQNRLEEKVKADAGILQESITLFLNRYLGYNLREHQEVEFVFLFEDTAPTTKEANSKGTDTTSKPLSYQEQQLKLDHLTAVKGELNTAYKILEDSSSYEEALSKIEGFDDPELEKALERLIFTNAIVGEIE